MTAAAEATESQMVQPMAVCFACGETVVLFGGKQFFTCEHQGGAVTLTAAGVKAFTNVA